MSLAGRLDASQDSGVPELPEVEVTRRRIEPLLVGRRIARITTTRPSYFFLTSPRELRRRLEGRRVNKLERVGKYLLASFDDGGTLLLHLGMTGQLFSSEARSKRLLPRARARALPRAPRFEPDRHTHLVLQFADRGPSLIFRDVRKFGKCGYLAAGEPNPRVDKLGVDALKASGKKLHQAARRRKIPIKTLLLDQGVLAGVGNIYADEALYLARVRPTRRSDRVDLAECTAIVAALRGVLRRSIEAGGSSIDDFVQPDGNDGSYQLERRVYGRRGEPCPRCKQPIKRVVLGQRSTHFCPDCQR